MQPTTCSSSIQRNAFRLILLVFCSAAALARAEEPTQAATDKAAFDQAAEGKWENQFSDPCTGDWKEKWFLDGGVGTVKTGIEGMELTAGPEFKNDAHHMVLWTKESFEGDLKIDYDYTRLDHETRGVTILYIQATGSGVGPYAKDITKWNELRKVPAMETYYNHMNAYHISYAAFPNSEETKGYIRGRRYMPEKDGIKGTELDPEYDSNGLFAPGVKHHITVIKHERDLFVRIGNSDRVFYGHMTNTRSPAITEGRIGLRHMFTRSARYQNFRVSTPAAALSPDIRQLVTETHAASLKLREQSLRKTIAKDTVWPSGTWGNNLWCLAALYLNEKTDEANARLLKQAKDYIASNPANAPRTSPENPGNLPWTFFSVTDYVRTFCLFHSKSPHFPGRLKPETEAAMKEALWLWVSGESRLSDVGADDLLVLLGTENHDLNRRPAYYLITALLKDDPAYRDRKLADSHTVAEHAAAYTAYFREWPRKRAELGLWVELGSNTYQKYSWPALFNLHELAPDPVIRKRFGLLLDLAFIEEEQISIRGRRGGGRSRAENGANAFESYKNLLYASAGQAAGSSHSRVIETSRYQLPAAAILLRKREFPDTKPFVIRNRVLGESDSKQPEQGNGQRLAADSALVNYAYRTPHYLLGSTLQNPSLAARDPKTGELWSIYAGISRQKRWCGMLFDDPARNKVSSIYPVIGHGNGGRPQHSFWSVQHESALILQRIAPRTRTRMGSYNTAGIGIGFDGADLQKVEKDGWIFASNGKAFAAVKFLDGGYEWDEAKKEARPTAFDKAGDKSRILIQAGDVANGDFARFQADVLANPLKVSADKVEYKFGTGKNLLEVISFDGDAPEKFSLPRINGKEIDLRPTPTFQSPFLNGPFDGDRISVTVGPIQQTLDFSSTGD